MGSTFLVLDQYREVSQYNDVVGEIYHFSHKYLPLFKNLPAEIIYFEPAKKGIGSYFGYGKISKKPVPDPKKPGHYYIVFSDYVKFKRVVNGPLEGPPHYNPQNAVRYISEEQFLDICTEGGIEEEIGHKFFFDSHLLRLLGDQLIGKDELAIFELVKNSYDADAREVTVTLNLWGERPSITIRDDGTGMTREQLINGWLSLGSSTKRGDTRSSTPIYKREPLGEKGIGRLAAFKLGDKIQIITRPPNGHESELVVDLPQIIKKSSNLSELKILTKLRKLPTCFQGESHGTEIILTDLLNINFKRGDVRRFKRLITTLLSPFDTPDSFKVELVVPGHEDWVEDLLDLDDILDAAVWKFEFSIDETGTYNWEYSFCPPRAYPNLEAKIIQSEPISNLLLLPSDPDDLTKIKFAKMKADSPVLKGEMLEGIGPIRGRLFVFHRRKEVLQNQELRKYLDEQTGVRVYRDKVRIQNYGDPQNDWMGLDAYRINRPSERLANNSVIGLISLASIENTKLKEKTNREGFDENEHFYLFRRIMISVVSHLDQLRLDDRKRLDEEIKGDKGTETLSPVATFNDNIEQLEQGLRKHNLLEEFGPSLVNIVNEYKNMQDVVMNAGSAGLNLALIFHEVERGVLELNQAVKKKESLDQLKLRIESIAKILEGFAIVLRKSERKEISVSKLLQRMLTLNRGRFRAHKVEFVCPFLETEEPDFTVYGVFGLFLGVLNNLIDNSIYWSRVKRDVKDGNHSPKILVSVIPPSDTAGAIITVADNGLGFKIDESKAVRPFITTKPGGMGLGLYYSQLVLESEGGKIKIGPTEEISIPRDLVGGAAVSLYFRRGGKK